MAGSFSRELENLLNPLPKFADPEDDDDEATTAKVIEEFNEEDDDDNGVGLSVLRKNNNTLLSDTDGRYVGKAVSRKQLLMDIEGSDEEEDEDQYSIEENNDEEEDSIENEQSDDYGDQNNLDDTDEEEKRRSDLQLQAIPSCKRGTDITFPQGVDFHKLTEGMDDLGPSEGEEDDDGDDSEENEDMDEDESLDDEDNDGDENTLRTFSQAEVDEEVEKGKAVRNQLALWDQLLEGRIKIQKALVTANQLPQPLTFPEFKRNGGVTFVGALKNSHKALKALQRSVLELHDHLLCQNTDTRPIALGSLGAQSQDEEIKSEEELSMQESRVPKRKLEMAEYPNFMAKRFAAFQPYCNTTLQKWHDKTRLSMGKSTKGFGAFDRNILTQVEQVLMDKERLLKRTQTCRSEYRILGKKESSDLTSDPFTPEEGEVAVQQMKANAHLKHLDEDIFDDDDFYHQLLRELIERKTSAVDPNNQVAMGRQWLAIQKLRRKIKKTVDTKASKGRKIRYHIHSKLVNFMAPMDHSSMSDEARNELYRGLFGQSSALREWH